MIIFRTSRCSMSWILNSQTSRRRKRTLPKRHANIIKAVYTEGDRGREEIEDERGADLWGGGHIWTRHHPRVNALCTEVHRLAYQLPLRNPPAKVPRTHLADQAPKIPRLITFDDQKFHLLTKIINPYLTLSTKKTPITWRLSSLTGSRSRDGKSRRGGGWVWWLWRRCWRDGMWEEER